MPNAKHHKARLRAELKAQRAGLAPEYAAQSDAAMLARLLALPAYQSACTVFCYVSVGDEPDTRRFMEAALAAGKTVCVPRCLGGGVMEARQIASLKDLRPAPFGLQEPDETAPLVPPGGIDFAVVPCLACDATGQRLGHGGGYYDRYLPQLRCPTAALCRGALLQPSLPCEPFDHRVDTVITETENHGET